MEFPKKIAKYIKVIKELIINVFSFSLLILSQQILALPMISRHYDIQEFGKIILVFGICNILVSIFGTSIGNARLLDTKYYNIYYLQIFYKSNVVAMLLSYIIFIMLFSGYYIDGIIFVTIVLLGCMRNFVISEFRITNSHNQLFKQNIWYSIGIVIGTVLFYFQTNWLYIFLIAEIFSCLNSVIYLIKRSFFKTFKDHSFLSKSNIFHLMLNNGSSYSLSQCDRFIIYPLLGAASVSLFYAVSVSSRVGTLILNPLSNFILGKMSNSNYNREKLRRFSLTGTFIITLIYFFVSLIITPVMVKILYPNYLSEIDKLILPVCLGGAIMAGVSVLKPVTMRFSGVKKYNIYFAYYSVVLISLSFILCIKFNLLGLASAKVISSLFLLILLIRSLVRKSHFNKLRVNGS
ncbi:hypothetical protein [Sporosarcina sp. P7]|uniref:hypothetical protein n=1 Tax=Sporosarcina sp. P7 TaxID=2048244 RepID=UPI000C16BF98|nr:hypothetical protein [Sporosarcina sp. P7]PID23864.1 hypothetical protein CSV60_12445 [Sporosarcina sp. P7]